MLNISKENPALSQMYGQYPFQIVKGEDVFVYDSKGSRYLDLYGGHAVCIVGHNDKGVLAALESQFSKLMFYSNLAEVPIREEGAAKLLEFAQSGHEKVFFCNSGGEANENAIKIALKLTGRKQIVSFTGGFHGRTLLAIAATDNSAWHKDYASWIADTKKLEPNNYDGLSNITQEAACVILEPIQSIGGVVVMEQEFLRALRKRCDEVGALLIFDEVQTGMGRTGVPFVSSSSGIVSDISTVAKGLAGGFPMSAVLMTREVEASLKKGDLGATFGGHPFAVASMIATIKKIEFCNLIRKANLIEQHIRDVFESTGVKRILGKGCLLGLDIEEDAKDMQLKLFDKNIIVGTCSNPNLVHLLPPLTIETGDIDHFKTCLTSILVE